jgi:hypothetical protein
MYFCFSSWFWSRWLFIGFVVEKMRRQSARLPIELPYR